jgi:hypothetical protein
MVNFVCECQDLDFWLVVDECLVGALVPQPHHLQRSDYQPQQYSVEAADNFRFKYIHEILYLVHVRWVLENKVFTSSLHQIGSRFSVLTTNREAMSRRIEKCHRFLSYLK